MDRRACEVRVCSVLRGSMRRVDVYVCGRCIRHGAWDDYWTKWVSELLLHGSAVPRPLLAHQVPMLRRETRELIVFLKNIIARAAGYVT